MGASRGDFIKYPRTPHLVGSEGTSDDRRLGPSDSERILSAPSLIVEEKLDGTNVGIHFANGELILQCRGHEITAGMHPQYDLFKQWATTKQAILNNVLGEQFVMYGEWLYAKHSIFYNALPHYFFEFDIYDKQQKTFLDLDHRMRLLEGSGIETVPVLHRGTLKRDTIWELISTSRFGARFDNPLTHQVDDLMEGLYLRTESEGKVTARAKLVRPEFTEKVKQSDHWQYEKMTPNQLCKSANLW